MTKTFGDFFLLKKQNVRPFVQRDAHFFTSVTQKCVFQ